MAAERMSDAGGTATAREPHEHLIARGTGDFPELLERIADPPDRLYVRGDVDALHLPALAIVGSRNPTGGGRENAYAFAKHLGEAGFTIVSGLATGIDSAAHEGALDGGARTIAVLAHGLDTIYPRQNLALAERIAGQGALCTEFPPGSVPRREHFPQRNRLISGLALGTLVVEAAMRSGSLITARLASEQGREVFAIPGSIHNPMARGCHRLLKDGAKLVESAADIVNELGPLAGHLLHLPESPQASVDTSATSGSDYENLLDAMGFDPVSANDLAARSGLTIDQVSSMLLILELEGKVESQSGGRYARLPDTVRSRREMLQE